MVDESHASEACADEERERTDWESICIADLPGVGLWSRGMTRGNNCDEISGFIDLCPDSLKISRCRGKRILIIGNEGMFHTAQLWLSGAQETDSANGDETMPEYERSRLVGMPSFIVLFFAVNEEHRNKRD